MSRAARDTRPPTGSRARRGDDLPPLSLAGLAVTEARPDPAPGPARDVLADQAALRADRAALAMTTAMTGVTDRLTRVAVERLRGPRARRGTRYWADQVKSADPAQVSGGSDVSAHIQTARKSGTTTPLQVKALDGDYIVPDSMAAEIDEVMRPVALRVAMDAASDTAARLGRPLTGASNDDGMFAVDTDLLGALIDDALSDLGGVARRYVADVRDALIAGDSDELEFDALVDTVEEAARAGANRLRLDARTIGTALAGSAALEQARSLGVLTTQWISRRDDRVRLTHRLADGQVREIGEKFTVGRHQLEYPGDPSGLPSSAEEVFGCFVANTDVDAPDVEAAFRVPYRGELVTVQFASGRVLTGTPNHPVLTDRGWVPLGQLNDFDYAVCTDGSDQLVARTHPDPHRRPPAISEVYRALEQNGTRRRVSGVVVNFHGDRAAGEVDVVAADCVLDLRLYSSGPEQGRENVFQRRRVDVVTSTDGDRSLAAFALGADPTACGVVSGANEGDSTRRAELVHAQLARRATAPWLYAAAQQAGPDGGPVDVETLGQRLLGFTGEVALDGVISVKRDPQWSGHVYDLQTSGGSYTASGVIVHNCRCGLLVMPPDPRVRDALTTTAAAQAGTDGGARALSEAMADVVAADDRVPVPGAAALGIPALADPIRTAESVVGWRILTVDGPGLRAGQRLTLPGGTVLGLAAPRDPLAATLSVVIPAGTQVAVSGGTVMLVDDAEVTVLVADGGGVQAALF